MTELRGRAPRRRHGRGTRRRSKRDSASLPLSLFLFPGGGTGREGRLSVIPLLPFLLPLFPFRGVIETECVSPGRGARAFPFFFTFPRSRKMGIKEGCSSILLPPHFPFFSSLARSTFGSVSPSDVGVGQRREVQKALPSPFSFLLPFPFFFSLSLRVVRPRSRSCSGWRRRSSYVLGFPFLPFPSAYTLLEPVWRRGRVRVGAGVRREGCTPVSSLLFFLTGEDTGECKIPLS